MKWLEIIEIQSVGRNQALVESNLKSLLNEIKQGYQNQTIRIYNNFSIDTDFSIHISHESMPADSHGSSLGVRLVSTLKEFGLVNHHVWIERHTI